MSPATLKNPDPETYKLLYDEAKLGLARQERSLDELRSRTGVLIAASSVAAAFLGDASAKDGWGLAGILGIAAFVASVGLSAAVLFPIYGWKFDNDVNDLFTKYIESDDPATLAESHRNIAIHDAVHIDKNESTLGVVYWAFRGATIFLVLQVILLLLDIPRGG
jgi:hypothetical protein